jgi:hypothetical protein
VGEVVVVGAEGDAVDDAEEEDFGGEGVVLAQLPELALEVAFELEVAVDVEVDAAAGGFNDAVVAGVGVVVGVGVEVVIDVAGADEEVHVGMDAVVEHVHLAADAEEVAVFVDDLAVVDVGADFERGFDGEAEVAGDVGAEADAFIDLVGVVGGDGGVAGKDGDVHGFAGGGGGLGGSGEGERSGEGEQRKREGVAFCNSEHEWLQRDTREAMTY